MTVACRESRSGLMDDFYLKTDPLCRDIHRNRQVGNLYG